MRSLRDRDSLHQGRRGPTDLLRKGNANPGAQAPAVFRLEEGGDHKEIRGSSGETYFLNIILHPLTPSLKVLNFTAAQLVGGRDLLLMWLPSLLPFGFSPEGEVIVKICR